MMRTMEYFKMRSNKRHGRPQIDMKYQYILIQETPFFVHALFRLVVTVECRI